jgi:hypothetical protein
MTTLGHIHVPDTGNDVRPVPGSTTTKGAAAIKATMSGVRAKVRRSARGRRRISAAPSRG